MKRNLLIGCVILSIGLMGITGCTSKAQEVNLETGADGQSIPVSESAEGTASGTSLKMSEAAAEEIQKEKSIKEIKSITLRDIEGNVVDRTFTAEEIQDIEKAFNESFIMDTAHVEMITGLTMTIELEDGRSVFIHSYGEKKYIVATIGDGPSYHLGCELIGTLLLDESTQ